MSFLVPNSRRHRKGEKGYLLVGLLFMVALILVALAVAAPKMAVEIQRDKEEELIHRGNQYVRAIKLYYKKFGRYPSNISQLENSNNIRFLRKKYKDPFTGKDEWRIIHLGEAKVPSMGLFGQPAGSGATGSTGATGSSFGSSPFSSSTSGSLTGATGDTSSTGSSSLATSSIFGSSGSTNSTLGGGLIVGIASTIKRASLKEYKKQKHYNEWEFVYDPIAEQLQAMGGTVGGGGLQGSSGASTPTPTTPTNTQNTQQ
jgi:type II secretory pathway pseudopilin PulG